jgi:hypothetical protein
MEIFFIFFFVNYFSDWGSYHAGLEEELTLLWSAGRVRKVISGQPRDEGDCWVFGPSSALVATTIGLCGLAGSKRVRCCTGPVLRG